MSMFWLSKPYRYVEARENALAIGGLVEMPTFGLELAELAALPAEHQVRDVGVYARNLRISPPPIQGVRIAALMELAGVGPEAILVHARGRNGFVGSVWRREIERLAIVCYARGGEPLPRELGGPFRLVLPGFKDEARDVWDLAVLEFAEHLVPDATNRRGSAPAKPDEAGVVQGGLSRSRNAPEDPRTVIVPPPVE